MGKASEMFVLVLSNMQPLSFLHQLGCHGKNRQTLSRSKFRASADQKQKKTTNQIWAVHA